MPSLFERRISEAQVAQVLNLIGRTPNRRTSPASGDPPGFHFWFDGGACVQNTGSEDYVLDDGTTAMVASPAIWLLVTISFPNGETVSISQRRRRT